MTKNEMKFLERKDLGVSAKMVFLYLSSSERYMAISLNMLMDKLGMTQPTLIKQINTLEEKGGIVRIRRMLEGTKEMTSNYYLTAELNEDGSFRSENLMKLKREVFGNGCIIVDKNCVKVER